MSISHSINITSIDASITPKASIAFTASTASTASKASITSSSKVLIITYYWPPSGGAGVQRWLKFSKYLPEFGWEPIILTVDPEYAAYPVTDNSLTDDLPSSLKVHRTPATNYFSVYNKDKTKIPTAGFANSVNNTLKGKFMRFIRGNFFIPDPRRGWNKYAFRKACEVIEKEKTGVVVTTSPPHSTQLIGLKIKKKYPQIKWIADLRDPWTDIYYYNQFYPTIVSRMVDSGLEKKVLRRADRIIIVGPSLKNLFSQKVPGISEKTEVITNGYDEDDFGEQIISNPEVFTISYIGTLSDAYPVKGFLGALKGFKDEGNSFILRFIGTIPEKQKESVISLIGNTNVEFINSVSHNSAISYMAGSSVLLLIIPDHQSNKSIITGKLFEYMATGKPVLCLGPADGDASKILKSAEAGETFDYNDISSIRNFLYKTLNNQNHSGSESKKIYSRRELTRRLNEILASSFLPG
jgi:glycosyltransferase involved in cell wall biosynthesis